MTNEAIAVLSKKVGVRAACTAVGVAQSGYYRRHRVSPLPAQRPRLLTGTGPSRGR